MKKSNILLLGCATLAMVACTDDNVTIIDNNKSDTSQYPADSLATFSEAEWLPGGEKGTTTNEQGCYSNQSPAIDDEGLYTTFKHGENFFEHDANYFTKPFWGLGPAWVRSGCEYCHPSYGHGKRQEQYKANTMGNGYLLVIYHPTAGTDANGKAYAANSYITEVTGMPQTQAMAPFKAPVDESGIHITWNHVTEMPSGLPMKFSDGETFDLIYPTVTIDQSAFNTDPKPDNYDVRLESTIGMYGTGLIDAISEDSMKVQYQKEAAHATLNPAMWNTSTSDWATSAWYTLADKTKRIKKFTYALTRATLLDGPGGNAIWNITNVTRSDRHYLYTTDAWAKAMSEDESVISAIQQQGASTSSLLHPYYGDGSKEKISYLVNYLLGLNSTADSTAYRKYFVDAAPWNGQEEMTDENFYEFGIWHRGLGVPKARNLDNEQVRRGKKLFYAMGCTACHRPSWKIDKDNVWIDPASKAYMAQTGAKMVTYDNTTIWPYTDLVQHRLYMKNDIRTGWCRTTPLWGRGLSQQETGRADRLHDCRARNVLEAIMWHCYSKESDAYWAAKKVYNLSKSDRDALVAFINAI